MPNNLTNTKISNTYKGILHANGEALPVTGQVRIFDGYGTTSALKLGANCNGATICGTLSCDVLQCNSLVVPRTDTIFESVVVSAPAPFVELRESTISGFQTWFIIADNAFLSINRNSQNGPTSLLINQNDDVTISGNLNVLKRVTGQSFNATSSIRFKTNVTPILSALDTVQKLQGVRFDWKDTGQSDIGLIAEEVDKVLPEFVAKNDQGEVIAVDYGKLTAVLIEAIKELTKLIK